MLGTGVVPEIFERAYAFASGYVSRLDRSRLGKFAVSDARLSEQLATHFLYNSGDTTTSIELFVLRRGKDFEACQEVRFWRHKVLKSESIVFRKYIEESASHDFNNVVSSTDFIFRMIKVYDSPELIGYSKAGIWDSELIEKMIASGVDPSLCASLV